MCYIKPIKLFLGYVAELKILVLIIPIRNSSVAHTLLAAVRENENAPRAQKHAHDKVIESKAPIGRCGRRSCFDLTSFNVDWYKVVTG